MEHRSWKLEFGSGDPIAGSDPRIFSNRKENRANSKDRVKSNWKLEIRN
jgi:hypothetical protein